VGERASLECSRLLLCAVGATRQRPENDGSRCTRRLLALALAIACSGCASHPGTWSFSLSRDVYPTTSARTDSGARDRHREHLADYQPAAPEMAAIVFVIAALPLLIDVAILPVTGVHDLLLPILPESEDGDGHGDDQHFPPPPPPPPIRLASRS
jgi:hypothetical protein